MQQEHHITNDSNMIYVGTFPYQKDIWGHTQQEYSRVGSSVYCINQVPNNTESRLPFKSCIKSYTTVFYHFKIELKFLR